MILSIEIEKNYLRTLQKSFAQYVTSDTVGTIPRRLHSGL